MAVGKHSHKSNFFTNPLFIIIIIIIIITVFNISL
jgi:hypothetical protein